LALQSAEDFQIKAGHVIIAMTTPLGVDQLEIALLP